VNLLALSGRAALLAVGQAGTLAAATRRASGLPAAVRGRIEAVERHLAVTRRSSEAIEACERRA